MGTLDANAILKHKEVELRTVEIPEWGGTVYLRPLTSRQAEYIGDCLTMPEERENARRNGGVRAIAATWSLCDADGKRLFADEQSRQVAALPAGPLMRIWREVVALSRMSEAAVAEQEGN
jgi:hypothetical protein